MKVTVTKNLNVRVGKPELNAPCYQYLAPGSILEVDGNLYKGDSFNGIDTWMKDDAGNYYWSGGLINSIEDKKIIFATENEINIFKSSAIFPPVLIDWNSRIARLPDDIKNNYGSGIKIAVLDTGIEKHHLDLEQCLTDSKDFTGSVVEDQDIQGHGTEMVSLIAGNPFLNSQGLRGIAPKAKICSAKVMYDENDPQDFLSVGKALDYVLKNNVDIINLSIGRKNAVPVIADKISQAKNTIFFASTREYSGNLKPADLLRIFPANCPEVIPVSALKKEYLDKYWNDLPSPMIIVPLFDAWSCSIKYRHYYFQDAGSSVSTAFLSGITALLLSDNPRLKRNRANILNELTQYSSTIEDTFKNPGTEIHFIVKS